MWKFTMQTWIARREISNTYFHPKEMKSAHLSGIFSEQNCDRIIREKKILFLSFLINQAWKVTLNWQMVPLSVKPTDVGYVMKFNSNRWIFYKSFLCNFCSQYFKYLFVLCVLVTLQRPCDIFYWYIVTFFIFWKLRGKLHIAAKAWKVSIKEQALIKEIFSTKVTLISFWGPFFDAIARRVL